MFVLNEGTGIYGVQAALNIGWSFRSLYLKAAGMLSGADSELHRVGYGGQIGAGGHTSWSDVGVVAGIRNNAKSLNDPVGDELQFIGIDAQQCLAQVGQFAFCIREAIHPLTRLTRSLQMDNGTLVRINSVTTQPLQFELAVSLRYYFGD